MTDSEVIAALQRADDGTVELRMSPKHKTEPMRDYKTTDGWRFTVFDDAGEWDGVYGFAPPGCESFIDASKTVLDWEPKHLERWFF